ncbi:DNA polymerase Y family protein [Actinoplanes sp. CA-051413]|uniref:DNA polymerase Y family protein n=1 Tax=Actinoplanes sp. CA-051413 TaxID=3239899 RepID=UPI003D969381
MSPTTAGVRTLVLWCPDWPVIAAEIVEGIAASGAVAVLHGNRVLACSEAARADGVRRGLRRREAQSRCPQLVVVDHDPGRDARAFEPVVAAVEEVAVGVEVIRAGACALAARGPARYFGGEELAAERIVEQVAQACAVESQVGIADGVFAAGLAARSGTIVGSGRTREFLAAVPVEALERPDLADLLRRLGVKTLGDFAALPASDVLTRFGFDGALAHRLAGGFDHRPLAVRQPPPDLDVSDTYDEPLERVDVAAFAGRVLAERLHERLAAHGLACTRLGIEAVTADGQELHRVWRHEGLLTAAAIAERVRWQLDGWLTGARRGAPNRPTAGLVRLRLVPDGVLVHLGLQPGLWGDTGAERERAHRALSRIQGLLGPEAVLTAVLGGGRSADDQVRLVPWGDERTPARPTGEAAVPLPALEPVVVSLVDPPALVALPSPPPEALPAGKDEAGEEWGIGARLWAVPSGAVAGSRPGVAARKEEPKLEAATPGKTVPGEAGRKRGRKGVKRPVPMPPWPGRLPRPAPALVLPQALPAVVLDADRRPVGVSARLELTGDPTFLLIGTAAPVVIAGWAGPWPVDERWWAPAEARRRARFQVSLDDGRALLLSLAAGHWAIEAIYD